MNFKTVKSYILKFIIFIMEFLRPLVGVSKVCIYPIDCSTYAKALLDQKPFFVALLLISKRVISCNPITVLFWNFSYKKRLK